MVKGSGLSAKRLLGSSSSTLDSCKLLGLKRKKCRKVKRKARKIKRKLKKPIKRL